MTVYDFGERHSRPGRVKYPLAYLKETVLIVLFLMFLFRCGNLGGTAEVNFVPRRAGSFRVFLFKGKERLKF
jgi:hypothetical protein